MTTCLDSSAVVQLLTTDTWTREFQRWWDAVPEEKVLLSSDLLAIEIHRVRIRDSLDLDLTTAVLDSIARHPISPPVVARACTVEAAPGTTLRALDAIHLATALELEASELVTYDRRLAAAAAQAGLDVVAPGRVNAWWDDSVDRLRTMSAGRIVTGKGWETASSVSPSARATSR